MVLELFTSQGCSSCPPADVLLDKAKRQHPDEVFALSYHVDYWNYIGWEDPFSKSQFTKKQREYNTKFQYSSNYTPELVINGKEHLVGSNATKLNSKIKEYGTIKASNHITLGAIDREKQTVSFEYKIQGTLENKGLRAVLVLDEKITVVKRGENRNRTLKNSNIVIAEKYIPVDTFEGSTSIALSSKFQLEKDLKLIVLLENSNLDITAAAKASL